MPRRQDCLGLLIHAGASSIHYSSRDKNSRLAESIHLLAGRQQPGYVGTFGYETLCTVHVTWAFEGLLVRQSYSDSPSGLQREHVNNSMIRCSLCVIEV